MKPKTKKKRITNNRVPCLEACGRTVAKSVPKGVKSYSPRCRWCVRKGRRRVAHVDYQKRQEVKIERRAKKEAK